MEKYKILAMLDSKTCEICGELDGKVYEVGKEITGVNMPPFHPLCRCTDVPHYEDMPTEGLSRVARDPETGKTYEVPADMTYKQWRAQYVEKNPDKLLAERKQQNKKADNEQFQRYRKILGKDAPETLDSFQTMKYTDSEKWELVQLDYSRRNKLIEYPELKLPNAENVILPEGKFTKYLLGGCNEKGLAKGRAITSRLGYNISNWKEFQNEIAKGALRYPAEEKETIEFGKKYEQKMILYGKMGMPANVIVGWLHKLDGSISMTSAYIKEV